ncbi:hypothetical protein NLI96_g4501 [Meripilus lineatus]|uniref:Ubiquitin-like domain-containing protein n=1 Tax=Meripilus lineatus TaxID=2056292 RepID=A0AAD5V6H5_9APHY|nr:hypothetical protein NLI96_g4501 [Physisporinus lineatus]
MLPTELVENVVLSLPLPEIVKWRQLSHFSKRFIDNTSAIQYRIAVLAHDIDIFDVKIGPMVDKLRELRLYLIAQNTLRVNSALAPSVSFADLGTNPTWKMLKNGLVMVTDKSTSVTTVFQFSSPSRGIPFREWKLDSSDSPIISIDPSQDLLVLVFKTSESLKIRITSLSSGGKHPLSNITEKDIFIDALESSDLEARIVGDEVLIDSTVDDEDWGVEFAHIVISWKTGRIRTRFRIENAISCVLLDTDYFLFLSHYRSEDGFRSLKLSVVDMAADTPSRVHFLLPNFVNCSDCEDYYITASLETGSKLPLIPRPGSFPGTLGSQSEIHDNLIALGISFNLGSIDEDCLVLISSFQLSQQIAELQEISSAPNDTGSSWSDWGPSCTAFFPGHVQGTPKNGRYSVEGTRYIGWHSDVDVDKVVMYDFNRFGVEHDKVPESDRGKTFCARDRVWSRDDEAHETREVAVPLACLGLVGMAEAGEDVKPKLNITVEFEKQACTVKVKATTPFRKIFEAAGKRFNKEANTFKFFYDGRRLRPEETPADHDMEDGDVIDAHLEQLGGL